MSLFYLYSQAYVEQSKHEIMDSSLNVSRNTITSSAEVDLVDDDDKDEDDDEDDGEKMTESQMKIWTESIKSFNRSKIMTAGRSKSFLKPAERKSVKKPYDNRSSTIDTSSSTFKGTTSSINDLRVHLGSYKYLNIILSKMDFI